MSEGAHKMKSFAFTLRIVRMSAFLQSEERIMELNRHALSGATAIGAAVRETEHADSKADIIYKFRIA